ncbi:hypothetical protein CULT_1870002 [[Clostridium] ultunense Esp]|nr:hypothetical protein CULT_1870002 [[Clostridium] ultunense Esp]
MLYNSKIIRLMIGFCSFCRTGKPFDGYEREKTKKGHTYEKDVNMKGREAI